MITLADVVVLDVLPGLLIGVVLSVILFVGHVSRPRISVLGASRAVPGTYVDVARHPDASPIDDLLIVRPDVPLWYANAQSVRDAIEAEVGARAGTVHGVVLDLDVNDEIDLTVAEQLGKRAHALTGE